MEYPNLSGEEFKRIINLFKWIATLVIGAITIIVSVALFVSFSDVNSMREDLREKSSSMINELKEIKQIARQDIERTQKYSFEQIDLAKEFAVSQAKSSAINKIEEIFERGDIQGMITQTAEKRLRNELDKIVNEEVAKTKKIFEEQIDIVLNMDYLQERIKDGNRKSWLIVDSLRLYSPNPNMRIISQKIIDKKSRDYAEAYRKDFLGKFENGDFNSLKTFIKPSKEKPYEKLSKVEIINRLIDFILEDNHLYNTAIAFVGLEFYLNREIKMLDFEAVENLKKELEK